MPHFTQHIITIVNNCQQFIELAQQIKQIYWPKRTDHYQEFEKLVHTYQVIKCIYIFIKLASNVE